MLEIVTEVSLHTFEVGWGEYLDSDSDLDLDLNVNLNMHLLLYLLHLVSSNRVPKMEWTMVMGSVRSFYVSLEL